MIMNVKELLIVALVCLVGYGIYVEASLWFSAFDKGRGYDKCSLVLKDMRHINVENIFAKNGMTLYRRGAYWRGKRINLVFYIKEKECSIPSEIDTFIHNLENSIGHSRVLLEIRHCPLGKDTNHWDTVLLEDKMYFWWRLFY